MTPRERVQRARRMLMGALAAAALLWAAACAMAVVTVAAILDAIAPLPSAVRLVLLPLMVASALVAMAAVLWRARAVRSIEHVALWVEERDASLQYALVASVDVRLSAAELPAGVVAAASEAPIETVAAQAARRAVGMALGAALAMVAMVLILQPRDLLRASERALAARGAGRPPILLANRLTPLWAELAPPRYSRLPHTTIAEPHNLGALVGTAVTLTGRGAPTGVVGSTDSVVAGATAGAHGWMLRLTLGKTPAVLTLRDRQYQRLVVLIPRLDSAPVVEMHAPLHDTTYQSVPVKPLALEAHATDDLGLASGYFEILVSTGSGENFKTVASETPHADLANARGATLSASLRLDTLKLAPGSVVHIRAVAFDYNDVTGPGKGVSETRTLRIAEKVDSTSIAAAPLLPIDSMWISQRLLNMKTDTLIRSERRLAHEELAHRSSGYSNAQDEIRRKVMTVVGLLENNGEGGQFKTDESTLLRKAADLMWNARADLGVALPDSAYPFMKQALKILDQVRLAYRYYLRGLMPPVSVNIARVRLQGQATAAAAPLAPRGRLPDPTVALAARIEAAVQLYRTAPAAAVDSLTYIRVAAIDPAPAVATALDSALSALRRSVPITDALRRPRRLLEPPGRVVTGAAAWQGWGSDR